MQKFRENRSLLFERGTFYLSHNNNDKHGDPDYSLHELPQLFSTYIWCYFGESLKRLCIRSLFRNYVSFLYLEWAASYGQRRRDPILRAKLQNKNTGPETLVPLDPSLDEPAYTVRYFFEPM